MFDSQLIMAPHVKSVVKSSSFRLRNIKKVRRVLTEDAAKSVMQSLVKSRLDYCNALLTGIQQDLIDKLQRLQNTAARIVSRNRKYEHITPVLIKLHSLPIKFLLLVYTALNGLAPKYIKEMLVPYKPKRHIRSEAKSLGQDSNLMCTAIMECTLTTPEGFYIVSGLQEVFSKHTFSGSPIEALWTMTQTTTMCSAFEHFMKWKWYTYKMEMAI